MKLHPSAIKRLKKGQSKKTIEVIDYFTMQGCFSSFVTMKDEKYFALVKEFSDSVTQDKALRKLGIDEDDVQEIEPVCLKGFNFSGNLFKHTKSGAFISSAFEVTWIFFSEEQLYLYECKIQFHNHDKTTEMTNEFFYQDVVSLAVKDESVTTVNDSDDKKNQVEGVKVDATIFALTVPGDQIIVGINPSAATEAQIQGMKQKLREKKRSA